MPRTICFNYTFIRINYYLLTWWYDFGIKEFGKYSWPPQEFHLLKLKIWNAWRNCRHFMTIAVQNESVGIEGNGWTRKKNLFKNSRRCSHYLSHLAIFKNIVFSKIRKKNNMDVLKHIYPICVIHKKEWHFQMDLFLTA